MKKIIFLCPYFGKLPENHIKLWLQSCKYNPDVDWIVFTDDKTEYEYPANVKVVYLEFTEFIELIQKKFEFPIRIKNAYKLCDFKPTYGFVLSEYIEGYQFWGHCDISDCIFGQLRKFITDDILKKSDKIGFLGHMTIYRNTDEVNKRFMIASNSGLEIKDILGNPENMAFDELANYSINTIYEENDFCMTRIDEMYVDISPMRFAFQESCYSKNYTQYYKKKSNMIFMWDNGKLYKITAKDNHIQQCEIGYVHFQKRNMITLFENGFKYIMVPNKFLLCDKVTYSIVVKYSRDKVIYKKFWELKWKALKYRIRHLRRV